MSHPAKNYSRPPPRQGHAYPFIKLLFQKRGLEDSPFLSEIPVEALEGAEAARFGLKDACACEWAARRGIGAALPDPSWLTGKFRKIHYLQMLETQSCISAAKLALGAAHALQEQSRERIPSTPHRKRVAELRARTKHPSDHCTDHPTPLRVSGRLQSNRIFSGQGCAQIALVWPHATSFRKPEMKTEKRIIGSINTLCPMDSAIQQPLLYMGSSQWNHLLPV